MFFGFVVPNNSPKKPRILVTLPDAQNFYVLLLILHIVNVITKLRRSAAGPRPSPAVFRIASGCVSLVLEMPTDGKHPAKICPNRKGK